MFKRIQNFCRRCGKPATAVISLFMSLFVFCLSSLASSPQRDSPLPSTAALASALRQTGATVLLPDIQVKVTYFVGAPSRLTVDSGSVISFEYTTAEAANRDAALVSPDGSMIGQSRMEWGDAIRFYKRDRVIVLYIGNREATIRSLEAVLGAPFVRGQR